MERYCSTGQSPQWAVASTEEEEEDVSLLWQVRSLVFASSKVFNVSWLWQLVRWLLLMKCQICHRRGVNCVPHGCPCPMLY